MALPLFSAIIHLFQGKFELMGIVLIMDTFPKGIPYFCSDADKNCSILDIQHYINVRKPQEVILAYYLHSKKEMSIEMSLFKNAIKKRGCHVKQLH
jgi:hypothetical protein